MDKSTTGPTSHSWRQDVSLFSDKHGQLFRTTRKTLEDDVSLEDLLADIENEASRERAYQLLWQQLRAPGWARKALGKAVTEEVKQDCLRKLLVPPYEGFVTSTKPLFYAQAAFENALKSELRKWRRQSDQRDSVQHHFTAEQESKFPSESDLNARLDAQKSLTYLGQLTPKQRVAVLLTNVPHAISDEDWKIVAGAMEKPATPLSDDDASKLLFPPEETETTEQEYQRRNSFRRLRKRAYEQLKGAIEEDV